ncbi:AGAP011197-PA-like protein [Anopheles sinensis]|uniref:AGAP011197-PA-like protein n=1 Tax=Anopheles sinensis TaxID=74873 RepID=A0A084WFN7_ANOSI|nr:AGAP011197-PA-like protein [Anopheles sinensis]
MYHPNAGRLVTLLSGVVLVWQISSGSAEEVSVAESVAGYGFEVMMAKLDFLQYKLYEIELGMKERDEEATERLTKLEDAISGIQWAISTHDRDAAHNLTVLHAQSQKILAQQTACANHEKMRQEIAQLTKNAAILRNYTSIAGNSRKVTTFKSCKEAPAYKSGVYTIQLAEMEDKFDAICEQYSFGGGWLVVQFRFNGSVSFYRNWTEYQHEFGSLDHEFWIGLEKIYRLTSRRPHEIVIEIKDFDGNWRYACYDEFEIGSSSEQYVLKKLGAYNGTAGNGMFKGKGMGFSTYDKDNDKDSGKNIALTYRGAWWYDYTLDTNLNGKYMNATDMSSMSWFHYKGNFQGLAYSRIMIREV